MMLNNGVCLCCRGGKDNFASLQNVGAGSANSTLIYTPVSLVIWEAYLYRPSFRPADTFLPIREKGLTYRQFCIAF